MTSSKELPNHRPHEHRALAAAIQVNQVGYLATGPKRATLVAMGEKPVPWSLMDVSGTVLETGHSAPCGMDPTVGEQVQVVDFTQTQATGDRLRLRAGGVESEFFAIGDDLYDGMLYDALTVFTLQRSGQEITADLAGAQYARAAGHLNVPPNRGDRAVRPLPAGGATTPAGVDLYQGWTGEYRIDAHGGWYDAGDHGKYVVNAGISVAQLLGIVERERRGGADIGPGSVAALALAEARFELEWLLRMQVPTGLPLAGMAHHKLHDAAWTPLPTLPAADPQERYLHRPSTAATLNLAAVCAQAARVFAQEDPTFAQQALTAARAAHQAAIELPTLLAPETNEVNNFGGGSYADLVIDDELYWAAAELYLTTTEDEYLAHLEANPYHLGGPRSPFSEVGFDWRDVAAWARMQLAAVPSSLPSRDAVIDDLVSQADQIIDRPTPFGQLYAPTDHKYAWGSNGMIANTAALVATAFDVAQREAHRDAALSALDYLLGRNGLGLSYVTGYGANFAHRQHSRWYANSIDPSLPPPPPGTLAGGPNSECNDPASEHLVGLPAQLCYIDDIGSFTTNEMTINWNAALAWLVAFASSEG